MGNDAFVANLLAVLLPLAEGRGENPDEGGGILLIVGLILLLVVVIGTVWTLIARATSRRRGRAPGTGG